MTSQQHYFLQHWSKSSGTTSDPLTPALHIDRVHVNGSDGSTLGYVEMRTTATEHSQDSDRHRAKVPTSVTFTSTLTPEQYDAIIQQILEYSTDLHDYPTNESWRFQLLTEHARGIVRRSRIYCANGEDGWADERRKLHDRAKFEAVFYRNETIIKHIGNLRICNATAAKKYRDLKEVTGRLDVYVNFEAPALTSIGGSLDVGANFEAPALTSIGGCLDVGANFEAPALTSIGNNLSVRADFEAPALARVGGYMQVYADFEAPALTSVEYALYVCAKLTAEKLYSGGFEAFKVNSDIPFVVLSKKTCGGIKIIRCREALIRQGKVVGSRFYFAESANHATIGSTIKAALQDLATLPGEGDVEQCRV